MLACSKILAYQFQHPLPSHDLETASFAGIFYQNGMPLCLMTSTPAGVMEHDSLLL
jgi:hypothetical protein